MSCVKIHIDICYTEMCYMIWVFHFPLVNLFISKFVDLCSLAQAHTHTNTHTCTHVHAHACVHTHTLSPSLLHTYTHTHLKHFKRGKIGSQIEHQFALKQGTERLCLRRLRLLLYHCCCRLFRYTSRGFRAGHMCVVCVCVCMCVCMWVYV